MQITITLKDKQVETNITEGTQFMPFLQAVLTAVLATARSMPESHHEEVYELLNYSFSATLSEFIPDKELRPDLTAEALAALEEEYIDRTLAARTAPTEPIDALEPTK